MKKFGIALFFVILGAGIAAACDDDNQENESKTCTLSAEICLSGGLDFDADKCECFPFAPAGCSLTDAACISEGKRLDYQTCSCVQSAPSCSLTDAECSSQHKVLDAVNCSCICTLTAQACEAANRDYDAAGCTCTAKTCTLNESVCAAENKFFDAFSCQCTDNDSPACTLTEESCAAQNKSLDAANCKCVENTPDECSKDSCQGYCIDNSTCAVIGKPCTEAKSLCIDNVLVSCGKDIASAWEGSNDDSSLVWNEKKCGSKVCASNDNETACYEKCDKLDTNKFVCDENSGEDGDSLTASFTYTCKAMGENKLFVKTDTADCGNDFCDTSTGKCYEQPVVEKKKDEGQDCKEDGECYTNLCFANVCIKALGIGESCWDDKQCVSASCEVPNGGKSGKCVAGLALGKSCTSSSECNSGYCDSSKKVCAEAPDVSDEKIECTASSDCKSGMCDANLKCSTVDQPGIGSKCAGGSCAKGLVCSKNDICVLEAMAKDGEKCSKESAACQGEVLVTCSAAGMGSDKVYSTKLCPKFNKGQSNNLTCVENNDTADCLSYCAQEGDSALECDGEDHYYELNCTKVGNKLVYVRGKYKECGSGKTCDGQKGYDDCYI